MTGFAEARQQQLKNIAAAPDPNTPNPNPNPPQDAPAPPAPAPEVPAPAPNPEEDAKLLEQLKARGYKVDSLDALTRLNQPAPAPQSTEEQIRAAQEQKAAEVKAAFLEIGTEEEFTKAQEVLNRNDEEVAREDILAELTAEGFTQEEAERIYKDRYYIAEDGKFFSEKEIALGAKKLKSRGEFAKQKQTAKLRQAEQALETKSLVQATLQKWPNAVEEAFKDFNTKQTFKVTGPENQELEVEYNITPAEIKEIRDEVSDPLKVAGIIFNENKSTNIKRLVELLTVEKLYKKMVATSYSHGVTKALEQVDAVFPSRVLPTKIFGSGTAVTKTGKQPPGKVLFGQNKR